MTPHVKNNIATINKAIKNFKEADKNNVFDKESEAINRQAGWDLYWASIEMAKDALRRVWLNEGITEEAMDKAFANMNAIMSF